MSQLQATVRNPGAAAGLTAIAAFGPRDGGSTSPTSPSRRWRARRGCGASATRCPTGSSSRSPAPSDAVLGRGRRVPARHRRGRLGALRGRPGGVCLLVPARRPAARADGALDPLASLVLCDTMPGAVGQKLGRRPEPVVRSERRPHGPRARPRRRRAGCWPTTGPARPATATRRWRWRSGIHGRRRRPVVAYATQLMFFAFGRFGLLGSRRRGCGRRGHAGRELPRPRRRRSLGRASC